MNCLSLIPSVAVLAAAEQDGMQAVSRWFALEGKPSFAQCAALVFVVLVLLVVCWKVARVMAMREGRGYYSPHRLFDDLCRAHGLDFPSRKLLWRLAKCRELPHPAQLFLEPSWFDPANVPASLQPFRPQLTQLKQRLFGSAATASQSTNSQLATPRLGP